MEQCYGILRESRQPTSGLMLRLRRSAGGRELRPGRVLSLAAMSGPELGTRRGLRRGEQQKASRRLRDLTQCETFPQNPGLSDLSREPP